MKPTTEHTLASITHGEPADLAPWTSPGLVCFGTVQLLTAAGSVSISETFTSNDPVNTSITTTTFIGETYFRA